MAAIDDGASSSYEVGDDFGIELMLRSNRDLDPSGDYPVIAVATVPSQLAPYVDQDEFAHSVRLINESAANTWPSRARCSLGLSIACFIVGLVLLILAFEQTGSVESDAWFYLVLLIASPPIFVCSLVIDINRREAARVAKMVECIAKQQRYYTKPYRRMMRVEAGLPSSAVRIELRQHIAPSDRSCCGRVVSLAQGRSSTIYAVRFIVEEETNAPLTMASMHLETNSRPEGAEVASLSHLEGQEGTILQP